MRKKTLKFIKADYKESQVSIKSHITTLTEKEKIGVYNLFKADNGGQTLVVFDDQPNVLRYIKANEGSVFLIRLLIPSNNKYCYPVDTEDGMVDALTVARITVLVPSTGEDGMKNVNITESQNIIVN